MADKDNPKVKFQAEVEDKTKPGLNQVKSSFKKTAQDVGRKPIISQNQQVAMRAFNEKTEKGRQILTAFGGAMGGAAGTAVYYGGTLSYIVAMFKPLELAVMATIAAIAGLVYWVNQETEAEKAWREEREKAAKLVEKMTGKIQNYWDQINKVSAREKDRIEIQKQLNPLIQRHATLTELQTRLQAKKDQLDKAGIDATGAIVRVMKAHNNELLQLTATMSPLQEQLKSLSQIDVVAEKRAEDAAKKAEALRRQEDARRKARAAKEKELLEIKRAQEQRYQDFILGYIDEENRARKGRLDQKAEELEREKAHNDKVAEETRNHLGLMESLRVENEQRTLKARDNEARRLENLQRSQLDRERQAMQERMEYAAMGADAIVGLAQVLATGNAQAIADTLKGMAIEALARAAWHGIMAIASSFMYNPSGAAKHGTLAALYAGFAATYGAGAGLATSAVGGGGGGGAAGVVGGSATPGFGGETPGRTATEDQSREVVINVWGSQFFGGDAGREVDSWVTNFRQGQNPGRERSRF